MKESSELRVAVSDELVEAIAVRAAEIVLERQPKTEAESPWLSITDAATYLGVSARQLQRAITKGRLVSSTIGRRRLLNRDDLDRFARAAGEE
jgi:excisionase family DNA binding protein